MLALKTEVATLHSEREAIDAEWVVQIEGLVRERDALRSSGEEAESRCRRLGLQCDEMKDRLDDVNERLLEAERGRARMAEQNERLGMAAAEIVVFRERVSGLEEDLRRASLAWAEQARSQVAMSSEKDAQIAASLRAQVDLLQSRLSARDALVRGAEEPHRERAIVGGKAESGQRSEQETQIECLRARIGDLMAANDELARALESVRKELDARGSEVEKLLDLLRRSDVTRELCEQQVRHAVRVVWALQAQGREQAAAERESSRALRKAKRALQKLAKLKQDADLEAGRFRLAFAERDARLAELSRRQRPHAQRPGSALDLAARAMHGQARVLELFDQFAEQMRRRVDSLSVGGVRKRLNGAIREREAMLEWARILFGHSPRGLKECTTALQQMREAVSVLSGRPIGAAKDGIVGLSREVRRLVASRVVIDRSILATGLGLPDRAGNEVILRALSSRQSDGAARDARLARLDRLFDRLLPELVTRLTPKLRAELDEVLRPRVVVGS